LNNVLLVRLFLFSPLETIMSEPDLEHSSASIGDPLGVTTLIGYEHGQWVVYLEVAFRDGVRRHRIHAYSTKRKAEIAADFIRQGALRSNPFRLEGLE
jgi:hypothetical protein